MLQRAGSGTSDTPLPWHQSTHHQLHQLLPGKRDSRRVVGFSAAKFRVRQIQRLAELSSKRHASLLGPHNSPTRATMARHFCCFAATVRTRRPSVTPGDSRQRRFPAQPFDTGAAPSSIPAPAAASADADRARKFRRYPAKHIGERCTHLSLMHFAAIQRSTGQNAPGSPQHVLGNHILYPTNQSAAAACAPFIYSNTA